MSLPVYKVEFWSPGVGAADYSLTTDVRSIYFKELLTDGVGNFNVVLETKKDAATYYYNDIVLNDKIKIWLGYDTIAGDPLFVGKVSRISAPLSVQGGYVRQISGLSQGNVLLRRLKTNTMWNATEADDIVATLANDLGLGVGHIEVDTTAVTMEVESKRYIDVLKDVSDYWFSAGVQIKKDFYVNVDNELVWASRDGTSPFRSGGSVETLTVGGNIDNYNVIREIDSVFNNITSYGRDGKIGVPGEGGRTEPSDMDSWTENTTGWTLVTGVSLLTDAATKKVGTVSLTGISTALVPTLEFSRPTTNIIGFGKGKYQTLNFWWFTAPGNTTKVRLHAPDSSNYFQADLGAGSVAWQWKQILLGQNQEYDVDKNPTGPWTKSGSPNWSNLQTICFYGTAAGQFTVWLDNLYFGHGRWRYTISDPTSITDYDQRDLETIDERLSSDNQCEVRAKTLLYQKKDYPLQIDVATTSGNTNILVGDRLSMTIPAENISAANYDVFSVEQTFIDQGFSTKASMMNSANIREPIATTPLQTLIAITNENRRMSTERRHIH